MAREEDFVAQARALAPWHLAVDITPDLNTRVFSDAPYPESFGKVRTIEVADKFKATLARLYPNGLEGRSVLDVGCNCGGYLFWARDLGAGTCLGVDVREHWIRQAEFLREHRGDGHDMRFDALDLYELPSLGLELFDVTFFNGIFYHLPDPISALRIASTLTKDVLILQTSTTIGVPDGFLRVARESKTRAVSGVHGLNWFPAGPGVITRILEWVGFTEVRSSWWERAPTQPPGHARLEMVAAKSAGALDAFDAASESAPELQRLVERHVAPESTVAILSPRPGETFEFAGRTGVPFPEDPAIASGSPEELLQEVERFRMRGAKYLVIREGESPWLAGFPGFRGLLHENMFKMPAAGFGRTELYALWPLG